MSFRLQQLGHREWIQQLSPTGRENLATNEDAAKHGHRRPEDPCSRSGLHERQLLSTDSNTRARYMLGTRPGETAGIFVSEAEGG